jgi:DNA-binding FadR family transcriptional regulator
LTRLRISCPDRKNESGSIELNGYIIKNKKGFYPIGRSNYWAEASMRRKVYSTAVEVIARALRAESLAHEEGDLIGSEDELLAKYGVSRPTFKQAAILVAQEQLLTIRRGVGGGYFANRPRPQAVAHIAAIYLQAKNAAMDEIFISIMPIRAELARQAALSTDAEARHQLELFLEADLQHQYKKLSQNIFDVDEYRAYLKSELEFSKLISTLANSKVLALFLHVLNDFCALLPKGDDLYRRCPTRVIEYCDLRRKIINAILDGDPEIAVLCSNRAGQVLTQWLQDDQSERGADYPSQADFMLQDR